MRYCCRIFQTCTTPPTTLAPLQVDSDKKGSDSDHNIVVLAPMSNAKYKIKRTKKSIKIRPLPESQVIENDLINTEWNEVLNCTDIDEIVSNVYNILGSTFDKHFLKNL